MVDMILHPATRPFPLLITILLLSLVTGCAQSRNYFISANGNDTNSGLSQSAPWKTIDKLNHTTFQPGDSILFHSGDIWHGQAHPLGSGAAGQPICVDRYGDGPMPVINLGAATGAAFELINQQWWTIQNLEITSGAAPQPGIGRQGIVALAQGPASHTDHLLISNCYIHDIWGQLGGAGTFTGYASAAIFVGPAGGRGSPRDASADFITIQNNRIERIDRCGIIVRQGHQQIIVRNNTMENLGGDAIFLSGCNAGLMEHNIARRSCMRTGDPDLVLPAGNYNPHSAAMWIQNCTDTLMQFNEAYDTGRQKGNGDGNAYDFDFNCRNCIAQYNYSRNNHGFLLIMERTQSNIARYNISENDQSHLIQMHGTLNEGNQIYNNVFYVDYGTIDIDFYMGAQEIPDADKSQLGAHFQNNIFYATGQGRFRTVYTYGSALERKFLDQIKVPPPTPGAIMQHNWYFGPWLNGLPDDPEPSKGDPKFLAPGTGGIDLATLTGYQLQSNSPCINTASLIPNHGSRDFYGNPLKDTATSFGVFEQPDNKNR
jgi:Right handed beta helix region